MWKGFLKSKSNFGDYTAISLSSGKTPYILKEFWKNLQLQLSA